MGLTSILLAGLVVWTILLILSCVIEKIEDKLYDKATYELDDEKSRKLRDKYYDFKDKWGNLASTDAMAGFLAGFIIFAIIGLICGISIACVHAPRLVEADRQVNLATYTTLVNALSDESNDQNYLVPEVIEWNKTYTANLYASHNPWINWYVDMGRFEGTDYIDITDYILKEEDLSEYEAVMGDENTVEKFGFAYIRFMKDNNND